MPSGTAVVPTWKEIENGALTSPTSTSTIALAGSQAASASPALGVTASPPPPTFHTKHLAKRIDFNALRDLAGDDQLLQRALEDALRYVEDPEMYKDVPIRGAKGIPRARLTMDQVKALEQTGVIREISAADVRGHIEMFTVLEVFKNRLRPIKWPKLINAVLGADTIDPDMDIAGKRQLLQVLQAGKFCAQFDGSSFFDQIMLHPLIGVLMAFTKCGKYYCMATCPMGQRQSVQVAQRIMQKIIDVPGKRTSRLACIDNGLLVGDYSSVRHDLIQVRERAKLVGCTLNEANEMEADIDSCIVSSMGETSGWIGICFDLITKETWLTEKVLAKLRRSWELLRTCGWNHGGWESHIGILTWSLQIIEVPMADFFALLRFHSRVCHKLSETGGASRDQPIVIPPEVMHDLTTWTELCFANKRFVQVPANKAAPTWLVCTDASRWGWGMVAVNTITGDVREHGERWCKQFRDVHHSKLHRSTFTEPQAVVNAMCYLLRRSGKMQYIIIGTDNMATKCAYNKGWNANSFDINECVRRLRYLFQPHEFSFSVKYVPGRENVYADSWSRGKGRSGASSGEISTKLRGWLWEN